MFDDFDLANGVPMPNGASGLDISNTSNTNPAAKVLESDRGDKKFKVFGNAYFKFQLSDKLNLRTSLGGNYQNTAYHRWRGVEHNRNGASADTLNYKTPIVFTWSQKPILPMMILLVIT